MQGHEVSLVAGAHTVRVTAGSAGADGGDVAELAHGAGRGLAVPVVVALVPGGEQRVHLPAPQFVPCELFNSCSLIG